MAPYLALCREDAEQREYPLRDVFNGLRYVVRTGCQWRYLPNDLPPWDVVYQQAQRWIRARCFETMVEDLRMLLREFAGRKAQPTAMILDSRTPQSTPESGARAGYDGAKRRKGSKVHAAVDILGHLLALHVTPADEQDRAQVGELAGQVQEITGEHVEIACVRSGVYRRRCSRSRRTARHRAGSGETYRGQTRFCSSAAPLGGGEKLRMGRSLPPPRPRLRATGCHSRVVSLPRLRLSHACHPVRNAHSNLITGSMSHRRRECKITVAP